MSVVTAHVSHPTASQLKLNENFPRPRSYVSKCVIIYPKQSVIFHNRSMLLNKATILSAHVASFRTHSSSAATMSYATDESPSAQNSSESLGPFKIIVVGAPGSGKGTQCKLLCEALGLVHISAGDVLRAAASEGTEMGLRAKECMDRGVLVPTEVAVCLVKERLSKDDCKRGWLLDGYPRSMSQYEGLSAEGVHPDLVILLDVNDDSIVERVVGRREDPLTGRIYHLSYDPPETEEILGRCSQRSDDTEEACRTRLRVHHQNVDLIRAAYKDVIVKVDGNRDKMEVFKDVERLIHELRD